MFHWLGRAARSVCVCVWGGPGTQGCCQEGRGQVAMGDLVGHGTEYGCHGDCPWSEGIWVLSISSYNPDNKVLGPKTPLSLVLG